MSCLLFSWQQVRRGCCTCSCERQLREASLASRARVQPLKPAHTCPYTLLPQISPGEAARWAALMRALGREEAPPQRFPVERAVLKMAAQRVSLAEKVRPGAVCAEICCVRHVVVSTYLATLCAQLRVFTAAC